MRTAALALLLTLALPLQADARPLTLRRADRAIDLALQAELAGDRAGARQALLELVKSSTTAAATAARAHLRHWLRAMAERDAAWSRKTSTAARYSAAVQTLAPFGLSRVERVWRVALDEVPDLRKIRDQVARIAIMPDRVIGVDQQMSQALRKQLARTFGRHGVRIRFPDVEPPRPRGPRKPGADRAALGTYWYREGLGAPFELRLEVDATGRRVTGPRVEVEARASYILKAPGPEGAAIGRFARRRRETRRTEVAARRFALFQVGLELAESAVVDMWAECLRQAAHPGAHGFDSDEDVRSN